jgi:hypothetical protein
MSIACNPNALAQVTTRERGNSNSDLEGERCIRVDAQSENHKIISEIFYHHLTVFGSKLQNVMNQTIKKFDQSSQE